MLLTSFKTKNNSEIRTAIFIQKSSLHIGLPSIQKSIELLQIIVESVSALTQHQTIHKPKLNQYLLEVFVVFIR